MLGAGLKDLETAGDKELYLPDGRDEGQSDSELSASDLFDEKNDRTKPKPEKVVLCKNINTRAKLLQKGILSDLKGQVSEAVSREDWFKRWGIYYIRSLRFAHQTQYKNNFKDEGIKQYGGEAFANEVERVNKVFDSLPPPEPSGKTYDRRNWGSSTGYASRNQSSPARNQSSGTRPRRVVNMSAYNNS